MILLIIAGCFDFVSFGGDGEGSGDPSPPPLDDTGGAPDSGEPDSGGDDTGDDTGGGSSTWSWGDTLTVEDAVASFVGEVQGDWAGGHIESLGDVNGDGVPDLSIGAPFSAEGATRGGKVYFVNGRSSGWSLHESLAGYPSVIGVNTSDELSGVMPLGDVNGDGLADTALRLGYQVVTPRDGQPMMYGSSGTWASSLPSSDADVVLYNSEYGWVETGSDTNFRLGDMNGDGKDDWALTSAVTNGSELHVVSGPDLSADTTVPEDGMLWITGGGTPFQFFASGDVNGDGLADALGISGSRSEALIVLGATLDLPMDEPVSAALSGRISYASGLGLAMVGDLTGDGAQDIAIPVYTASGDTDMGVHLFFGREDWETDLVPDDADVHISSPVYVSTARVGDLNGDGLEDLALKGDVEDDDIPEIYLFFGREDWEEGLEVTDADVTIVPEGWVDGASLRLPEPDLLGDLNGDGLGDLLITSPSADVDGLDRAGALWVFLGREGWEEELSTGEADLTIVGSIQYQSLGSLDWLAVSDLNLDGCDDLATSSARHPDEPDAEAALQKGETFLFFGQPGPTP